MKILHVLDHSIPLHSGYTFRTRAILEQQRALGWETDHITSPKHYGCDVLEETVDELHFFRTPADQGMLSKLPVFNQLAVSTALEKRLLEVVPKVKPDVIHAHSPALNGLAAMRVGKRLGIPVVYEIRAFWEDAAVDHGTSKEWGLRYRLTRALETHVVKGVDAVTTICEGLRGDLLARDVAESKITVIPNAVDIERFSMDVERDEALIDELGLRDKRIVGFIGSFYAYEGLSLLLDAMPSILKAAPDVRVLLVGGGPEEEALKAKVEILGLQKTVIFTGRVPHDQVSRYYHLVDVFAYPRLKMRLTDLVTPLKPLEAMAQGRLLVASDVGGHKELINDRQTGYLFKAGSADALAESVLSLMQAEESWPQIRKAGREFVETQRNWAVSVARYKDIYHGLVG